MSYEPPHSRQQRGAMELMLQYLFSNGMFSTYQSLLHDYYERFPATTHTPSASRWFEVNSTRSKLLDYITATQLEQIAGRDNRLLSNRKRVTTVPLSNELVSGENYPIFSRSPSINVDEEIGLRCSKDDHITDLAKDDAILLPPEQTDHAIRTYQSSGQSAGGKGFDGHNTPVTLISAASCELLLQHVAYIVATNDYSNASCQLSSSGRAITVGPEGEDLTLPDLVCACLPMMFAEQASADGLSDHNSRGVGPVKLFLRLLYSMLSQTSFQNSLVSRCVLILALLRFWMRRHFHRLSQSVRADVMQPLCSLLSDIDFTVSPSNSTYIGNVVLRRAARTGVAEISTLVALARRGLAFDRHRRLDDMYALADSNVSKVSSCVIQDPAIEPLSLRKLLQDSLASSSLIRSASLRFEKHFSNWISVPPALFASAWTYTEWLLFRRIPLYELLSAGWDDPRYTHSSDAVFKFVDRYQADSLWIATQVVRATSSGTPAFPLSVRWSPDRQSSGEHGTPRDRAAMVVRFVTLAMELRKLRNFCGLSAVLQGLRLKDLPSKLPQTWELVPQHIKDKIAMLSIVVSDSEQFKMYHMATENVPPHEALVPHLAAHTTRITLYASAHYPDRLDAQECSVSNSRSSTTEPLIHVKKWRTVYDEALSRLLDWQERIYSAEEMLPGLFLQERMNPRVELSISRGKDSKPHIPAKVVQPPSSLIHLLNKQLYQCYYEFEDARAAAVDALIAEAESLERATSFPIATEDSSFMPQ